MTTEFGDIDRPGNRRRVLHLRLDALGDLFDGGSEGGT